MKIGMILLGLVFLASGHADQDMETYGAISGGGGKGVKCLNADGSIKSVELLDLWEATALFDQTLIPSTGSVDADVAAALVRVRDAYPYKGIIRGSDGATYKDQAAVFKVLQDEASHFLRPYAELKRLRGVELTPTDDSDELARPTDCRIVQLVNYLPTGRILLDQDLFEKMDTLNQSALIVHEALYAFLRRWNRDPSSIRTRRATGYVFGGNTFALPNSESRANSIFCSSGSSDPKYNVVELFSYDAGSSLGLGVEIQSIDDQNLMGMPRADFRADFLSPDNVKEILSGQCHNEFLGAYSTYLEGPVEFDRLVYMQFLCEGGHVTIKMSGNFPGESVRRDHKLTCHYSTQANPTNQSLH